MDIKNNYKATVFTCCLGYITQAIMLNFPPLLYIFFQSEMGLSLGQVSVLISANIITELVVDIIVSKFADKLGQRRLLIFGTAMAAVGLCSMIVLPDLLPNAFIALLISMAICGMGGGIMEVLISPVVEACPTDSKGGSMSFLHSFYCWGQAGVVIISTLFFLAFGIESWTIIALIWTVVPLACMVLFTKVPIYQLGSEEKKSGALELFKSGLFWILVIMMICAGASELAMAQWASAIAETAINNSSLKWLTDILGPGLFAICMAITRMLHGKFADKLPIEKALIVSSVICIISYLITILAPVPAVALIGCSLCGVGVAIMWPATFSMSASRMPNGGVLLFGLLALAGDFGCLAGPFLAGQVSTLFGDDLRAGFVLALIFPITLAVISAILLIKKIKSK
ncbi:MAG: MFS transporter [Clostridia bacterium]|nr:MFS transporter [Clostridia bacterium]